MKQKFTMKAFVKSSLMLSFFISLFNVGKAQSPCDTIVVPTPVIDVRGNTDLCSGSGYLELCPSTWGYSNFLWYKDGAAYSTNSCIVITQAGSYTLTQQNGTGCWSVASTAVVATGSGMAPSAPTVTAGSATTFCAGNSVTLTSSATSNHQWYLDGIAISGAVYQNYNATATGVYTVTTSNCGGTSSESIGVNVTVTTAPNIGAITGANSLCLGDSTTLTDTTAGGTWSSSNTAVATIDSNGVVHSLSAGSTTITYTVSNGTCSASVTKYFSVISTTAPSINVSGSTTLCGSATTQLCPSSWGYSSYQWYKDAVAYSTNSCITLALSDTGSYTLQASNNNGCTTSLSSAVAIISGTLPATPTISAGSTTTFCSGGNVTLTSSAATGNQWYKDSIAIGGATNQTYNATASGIYTVAVTTCGSTSSIGITVNVITSINVTAITGATNICLGDSTTLVDTTAGGTWSSSDTTIATIDANGVVHTLGAGSVTISYSVVSGACTGSATKSLNIVANTTPVVDVRGSTTLCSNSTLQLCPQVWGYSNYQWYKDGVSYSTSACINITSAGSYTLSGSNSIGCWSAQSSAVVTTTGTPPATPTISAGGATTFCSGGSVTLTSSSATGNQWYKDSVAISGATNQTYSVTASGVYTVAVTACGSTSSTGITITVNAAPTVNAITGATSVCAGNTTTLSNTTAGGTWSSSNTSVATITSGGVVSALSAGNTTISYTVSNGTCSTSASFYFTVFTGASVPTINPKSSLSFCDGSSVQMCPLVWGYSNYQWYKDGVAFSTSACITATASGDYTLAAQNGAGCWSVQSAAATAVNNPLPTVNATTGATSVCVNASITLTNTTTTPSGGSAAWSSTAGRATVNSGGVVTGSSTGTANIRYTATTAAGCSSYADYAVTVNSIPSTPSISFAPGTTGISGSGGYCHNKTFTLVGNPTGGTWGAAGAFSITSGGVVTTSNSAGSGSVSYTVTNAGGCSNTRTINANVVASCKGVTTNQQNTVNSIVLYPNPAHSLINLKVKTLIGAGNIVVTDLYGKQIKQQSLSMGINTIDVSSLAKGMYLVSVITENSKQTQKVIVE